MCYASSRCSGRFSGQNLSPALSKAKAACRLSAWTQRSSLQELPPAEADIGLALGEQVLTEQQKKALMASKESGLLARLSFHIDNDLAVMIPVVLWLMSASDSVHLLLFERQQA